MIYGEEIRIFIAQTNGQFYRNDVLFFIFDDANAPINLGRSLAGFFKWDKLFYLLKISTKLCLLLILETTI